MSIPNYPFFVSERANTFFKVPMEAKTSFADSSDSHVSMSRTCLQNVPYVPFLSASPSSRPNIFQGIIEGFRERISIPFPGFCLSLTSRVSMGGFGNAHIPWARERERERERT